MSTHQGKRKKTLRTGFTTGACAAAAAKAAAEALRTGHFPDPVSLRLPKGQEPTFHLSTTRLEDGRALAGVVKDAGDDPDVTHGAEVRATVELGAPGSGVTFKAGEGIGTVTRPGLPIPPGEPAINPVPRRMIGEAVGGGDLVVTISIPGGEKLARKTLNGRLGIEGGLSVLGTTGIVVPYSCSAWIDAIRSGLSVARAAGLSHVAASTGRTSERAVQRKLGLTDSALIEMGDFAGGLLKEVKRHPMECLTIAGGFAKLAKLGQGEMDLHSKASRADLTALVRILEELGADNDTLEAAREADTAARLLELSRAAGLPLADRVAAKAREVALSKLSGQTEVDVLVFDRFGEEVGHA